MLAGDQHLRASAAEIDEHFTIADYAHQQLLASASPGAAYGPRTDVRHHLYERLFAVRTGQERAGLLRCLVD
jgi:hypothetical protein